MLPHEIEEKSFEIIDEEAGSHGFGPDEWKIVRRMIHTSADFEYIDMVRIHPKAIEAGVKAIQSGCAIVTDTNMARVGIRKDNLAPFGCTVACLMTDPEVGKEAKEKGLTRAHVAAEKGAAMVENGIYAVGNAPTALLHLLDLIESGAAKPALVVGLPVGFVNAAESKEALIKTDTPYISNLSRKGGSNVAVSVINALALIARERT
ncbi:Precorrin-8X methylmutase CbiC/CobH [Desulfatibacillum aliphaticivorans]|uniref:Precorrin-8X methylmutase CbiC/CobH n=1 Tax=Desulfatibacillum aliphaticivorans TaxID=218208 RepID=B8FH64_DESAL|nr:precorrin-8X methylmutase [Desulfatibacillum aliphaticivorans]ACL02152.1 Precorrin-8X methylmutase CbiC/CobH [Desulfatibacillum aliphaticivorans]